MIDADLAELYRVSTKQLNQQVKRNMRRFPSDFMFQLNPKEAEFLWSHYATARWGGRRYRPYCFTEHGVAMLSSVLNSQNAIDVNITIMRTIVKVRNLTTSNKELARKIKNLESKVNSKFRVVFKRLNELMNPSIQKVRNIGFKS